MNKLKDTLLVILALSVIGLAISQYYTGRVIAESLQQQVYVINRKGEPVPVVQTSQWEYKTTVCTGTRSSCYATFTANGLQGWELVLISPPYEQTGTNSTWDFVFKRPKL